MSERLPSILLSDMLDSITAVVDYSAGMGFDAFVDDRKTRDSVIVWRIIEVHLPPLKAILEDILNRSK